MLKTGILLAGLLCTGVSLYAQNSLIRLGNMDNLQAKDLSLECFANGGKVSFFTEEYTWNRCGKFEVTNIIKSGENDLVNATLFIGSGNKKTGFPCKPDTTYEFSIDIKGTAPRVELKAMGWDKGKSSVYSFVRLGKSIRVKPDKEWVTVKGEFKTGANTERAALGLQFWASSKYEAMPFKVGDYILFDNISVREKTQNTFVQPSNSAKEPLKITKIISGSNGKFKDFIRLRSDHDPVTAETSVEISTDSEGIRLQVVCHEPVKITAAEKGKNLWSGDVVEFFFGPKAGDRGLTQFVIGPDNRTFTGRGRSGETSEKWTHEVKTGKDFWQINAYIPFDTLGWKDPVKGDRIAFNIGRQRVAAKEIQTWAPVRVSFHEVRNYGFLLIGEYPDRMIREQFELADAKEKAARKKEQMERYSKYTFLAAPVGITAENTLPYMPDALFKPVEKIELNVAVNEIRALPVAIGNITDKDQTYRVTLERPVKGKWQAELPRSFPGTTVREAVAIRDNGEATGLMYDILPKINEASTITIPAKSARLVIFDIDTTGMKPGIQNGFLRINPLTEKGSLPGGYWGCKYDGNMRKIPFFLNVRNIVLSKEPARPGFYFSFPPNPVILDLAENLGQRVFMLSPWFFDWKLKDGKFSGPCKADSMLDYAAKNGMKKLVIGFGAWDPFHGMYGKKNMSYFSEWLKSMAKLLTEKGFKLEDCEIEVFDEPDPARIEEVILALKTVKETVPEIKSTVTFGGRVFKPDFLQKLRPYVDGWIFWRHGYFYKPEHLKFISELKKDGKKIMHYVCSTSPHTSLHANSRMNAWFGEYHQTDSDNMYRLIEDRAGCAWLGPTMGELLVFVEGGAVPTMRYMAVRQGVMDVKYLAKLREVGKNSPEAQAFLKTAAKRVVADFSHDASMPDKVREEAAQLILKLQK